MLMNLIKIGGSAMIFKEIADRVRQTRIAREETLRRKKAWGVALGVTIGSTVGVVAGLLFAPKAGKEMREDLSRCGCEAWGRIKENASDTGHRVLSSVEEKSSRVRKAAEAELKEISLGDEGTDKKK